MSDRSDNWKKWYDTLKAVEPDAFRKAIQHAEGITLNHQIESHKLAADIEVSHVMLACDLLGIHP